MKPQIMLTIGLYAPVQEQLERSFTCHRLYEAVDRDAFLKKHGPNVRALATFGKWGADKALIAILPKLEIIANMGVGVDAIDLDESKRHGIIVTNTPDVLDDCVAETAMSLVLNVLHRFPQCDAYMRSGYWATRGAPPLSAEAKGKTLGILGLGRIGLAVAKRAEAFDMKIRYHSRSRKDVRYPYDSTPEMLATHSDVLLIATAGGEQTRCLVNAKVLDAVGPTGYVVNISRGSVIDEPALLRYLKEGRIAGAGLDVFENEPEVNPEFLALQNAVLYPHVGSATNETRLAMGMLQVENLRAHFSGKPVLTRVV